MLKKRIWAGAALLGALSVVGPASADSADPDLIFRKSTTFKLLTPNDKLAVYGIDDPLVDGVACHYTAPEKGGLMGAFGLAEQTSDISLACRQYGPIKFKGKFEQGEVVFSERRSIFFKKDANRPRLRRQAQHSGLHDLYRQADRRLAEELDLDGAHRALGQPGRNPKMRGLRSVIGGGLNPRS